MLIRLRGCAGWSAPVLFANPRRQVFSCRGPVISIIIYKHRFRELLPVLTSRHLSYETRGHVYSSCVWRAMLHASETWPLTKTSLQRLQRNDRAMIRQICSIKPEDVARVRSSELLAKLQLEDLDLILREKGFADLGMWSVRVVQSD